MTRVTPAILIALLAASAGAAPLRDGRRFDPGAAMTRPAPGAPEEIARPLWALGSWDVTLRTFADGDEAHVARGAAEITFMNGGHAYMERFHCPDFDGAGHELDTVSFLTYHPATELWVLGTADGFKESIRLASGGYEGEDLVLRDASRRLGGSRLTLVRLTVTRQGDEAFRTTLEESTDNAASWSARVVRDYARRAAPHEWFAPASGIGEPAPDLPEEARRFDFLLGRFDEVHWHDLPSGQVEFPANGSAVRCLNGRGVLEFGWYDADANLPDAATSIVRVYNRNMRRWESMYLDNRFGAILHFGGAQEDDRIVLHQFEAHAGDVPMNRWIFHDRTGTGYRWHAESSRDRGASWDTTWTITATRRDLD